MVRACMVRACMHASMHAWAVSKVDSLREESADFSSGAPLASAGASASLLPSCCCCCCSASSSCLACCMLAAVGDSRLATWDGKGKAVSDSRVKQQSCMHLGNTCIAGIAPGTPAPA